MARYYKVVRQVGTGSGMLKSTTPCRGGSLYYSKKSFTRMIPGSLGLFVFDDLWLATSFAKAHSRSGGCLKVFSCEVKGKAEKVKHVQDISRTLKSFIKVFNGKSRKNRIRRMARMWYDGRVRRLKFAPGGSFTVQAVRLKRELRSFGYSWSRYYG